MPKFLKVGDRVRFIGGDHEEAYRAGDTGTVIQFEWHGYQGGYTNLVQVDRTGDEYWPADSEIELIEAEVTADAVNHPSHYNNHPSGVECLTITKHMNFCLGNAIKYIWRAGSKGDPIEDLRKAIRYLETEIERLQESKSA